MSRDELREKLAELEHRQWAHWYRYMAANLTPENSERWQAQANTPYELLSEVEKNSDREWADRVLEIVRLYQSEPGRLETGGSASSKK